MRACGTPVRPRWQALVAATDPHWRIRHALIQMLLRWGEGAESRQEMHENLNRLGANTRARGVSAYLHSRWHGAPLDFQGISEYEDAGRTCPFWDWDAAVLLCNLEDMAESGRRQALDSMPFLLRHSDERIRSHAAKTLHNWGTIPQWAKVVGLLDEPRYEGTGEISKLLTELDHDSKEQLARLLLDRIDATPAQLAWGLDQIGPVLPDEDEEKRILALTERITAHPSVVRCALARQVVGWQNSIAKEFHKILAADDDATVRLELLRALNKYRGSRLDDNLVQNFLQSDDAELRAEAVTVALRQGPGSGWLEPLAADPDARVRICLAEGLADRAEHWTQTLVVRLQADVHPHVRAAAMTPARAAELVKEPARETSWHVLAKAARLARVPLWNLAPSERWQPTPTISSRKEPLCPRSPETSDRRYLGPNVLAVTPLGISGHYGLPLEGFVRAFEAGVNLMFWEPNYRNLTEFVTRLGPTDRNSLHLLAGTFEADGKRIRRDAEQVLHALQIERIPIFLLFWVQSWKRVTPEICETLDRLKIEGKIGAYGLSTHSRPLAIEALDRGWDPVMVRHSAAHRGAEEQIFPHAAELGKSLITFSNTCYGRLLEPREGLAPPSAADCYRYTLQQPGVHACLSAPATLTQLEENLAALRDPTLPAERWAYLRSCGDRLYEEETMFRRLVRNL